MEMFTKIGLTKYEAEAYKALIWGGRLAASKISEISSIPPTAVYPSLKQLMKKGLVQKFEADIALFEAIEPKRAIPSYINQKKKNLEILEKEIITSLESLKGKSSREERKVLEMGVGREFSWEIYLKAFEEAKESIYILGWKLEKVGDKYIVLNKLKKSLKKKRDVRLILTGNRQGKQIDLIRDYKRAGIKIKYSPLKDFSLLIVDSKSCKITIKKKGEEKSTINILDENLTRAMKQYYLNLWNTAEDL